MPDAKTDSERCWESGWTGHAEAQRRRLARLSLPDKLAWLEQAHRVIRHLRAQGRPPSGSRTGDQDGP
jgi:hypothetical protein